MWTLSSTPSIRRLRTASSPTSRRLGAAGLLAALATTSVLTSWPVQAQQIVFDPRNHIQTSLQAARQLESLANEARQLANEARSLAASPYSHLAESSATLREISELARTARGLASTVEEVGRQFERLYPEDLSTADLLGLEKTQGANARRTAEDVARAAASLERLSQGRDRRLEGALSASAQAEGQTAAIQSSTQMLAVLAEDLAVLRTATLAQSRLMASAAARQEADRAAGAEARRRLWDRSTAAPSAPRFAPLPQARN